MERDSLRRPLRVAKLREEVVAPGQPWRYLEVVEETGSTNADLLARAEAGGDIDGVVLIAEHQTAGRGRMGRTWSAAPRAAILLSVGVSTADVPVEHWGWLPLAAGVAVVDAVAAETDVRPGLKWPNDVVLGDRKLAGIFTEVTESRTAVVVGIGLNVTLSAEEAGDPVAVSLLDAGVAAPDRDRLASTLLSELGRRVIGWRRAGGYDEQLVADYRAKSTTIGATVSAVLPGDRTLVGTAQSIDHEGRLVLDCGTETVALSAADIVHVR
ncbi:biotin--[acetyl-CoA-carboxylase] ligase [Mycolicibacterium elephantis]|uniref:biotin--[acetyl-CoA-carboxylase] ligase n=1 Tax=Mycolicibacterium elephantis TaxID=81858 RepID=UPI000FE21175|nr:biotin--[acetyl-CoA-carboxylase] ligase [Mycolicibacterium elephantis]MCV7221587.1 biotin--[acetyl-CoA-carboxylase] ligase [Mycolicibacterium elephantis]